MSRVLISFVSLLFCLTLVSSYKILCFYPTISKSQVVFGLPLLTALAEKGHQVTLVSPFASGKNVKNYHEVVIPVNVGDYTSMCITLNSYLY